MAATPADSAEEERERWYVIADGTLGSTFLVSKAYMCYLNARSITAIIDSSSGCRSSPKGQEELGTSEPKAEGTQAKT